MFANKAIGAALLAGITCLMITSERAAAWGCEPRVSANSVVQATLDAQKYLTITNMRTFGDEAVRDLLAVLNQDAAVQGKMSLAFSETHAFSKTEGHYKMARHALRVGTHLDGYLANFRERSYVAGISFGDKVVRMECDIFFEWGYFNKCVESTIQWCEVMDRGALPLEIEKKFEYLWLRAETGLKRAQ